MSHLVGSRFSRRQLMLGSGGLAGALVLGAAGRFAAGSTRAGAPQLPPEILAIMAQPRYRSSRWGLYVADLANGAILYDLAGEEMFIPASTTKLFAGAAALAAYGAGYRFETPIFRTGPVDAQGQLAGDLVLVASADLTMGGRDTPAGWIDFTSIDHINAMALPLATLTPEDPLAGLNDLAQQVAAAGIRAVSGNVLIDARLFKQIDKDDYILTPIWINDNLIDLTLTPGAVGQPASLVWRPQTAAYQVRSQVQTVAAGAPLTVTVSSPSPGEILLQGNIAADQGQLVKTYQVEDPPAFARTLLIEALQRQGISVAAAPLGGNPVAQLPPQGSYRQDQQVALHRSLPFSENLKLIEKTSHNQHADMLIFLLALKAGKLTFEDGIQQILPLVQQAGIDSTAVSLGDGRGNAASDLFSPQAATQLLRYMATRADSSTYRDALPILGVDGTEVDTVLPDSPVKGKAAAKSGTTVIGDDLHQQAILMTRGLAGYMSTRSGRELVFAVYVNYVALAQLDDIFPIFNEQGAIVEAIYAQN